MNQLSRLVGHVSELMIFPIKSLGGIRVNSMEVTAAGPRYDRRWMLVKDGKFYSQRQNSRLALIKTEISGNQIVLSCEGHTSVPIPLEYEDGDVRKTVAIWGDETSAVILNSEASKWISQIVQDEVQLVYMPSNDMRIRPKAEGYFAVGFADGYPLLITNTKSLERIQGACKDEIRMNRFRSNIVFEGSVAFEENQWKSVRVGDLVSNRLKPCERCIITSINQENANRGKDPLKALVELSSDDGRMIFGQNFVPENAAVLKVGDGVYAV